MAVPSAGTFTNVALQKIQLRADSLWRENMGQARYRSNVDTVLALQQEGLAGTAFRELQTEKDKTVRLVWLNACSDSSSSCSNDCTIGGVELSGDAKDYALDLCQTTGFQIDHKATRNTEFSVEDQIALGMINATRILDEWLNTQAITFIEANKGVSEYVAPDWSQSTTEIQVPAAEMGRPFIPKAIMTARKNRMDMPFLLSGENLWYETWNAQTNQPNAEGKGDAAAFSRIKTYHDLWGIDSANSPSYKTYLMNSGSVAFVSKAYFMTPMDFMTQKRYAVRSNTIPNVWYDVVYTDDCTSNEITHKFSLYVNAGFFLNPTGCSETRTGILSFTKV